MGKRLAVGGGIAALVAAAGLGGMAIAGDGDSRQAGPREVAAPMTATKEGPVTRAGAGGTIQTFYLTNEVIPDEGEDLVSGPRCPRKAGDAIGGGAATDGGIDLVYLSQANPQTLETSARAYYVGIEDVSDENGPSAGAIIEIQCAKGIRVEK